MFKESTMDQNQTRTNSTTGPPLNLRTRIKRDTTLKTEEKREMRSKSKVIEARKPNIRTALLKVQHTKRPTKLTKIKRHILVNLVAGISLKAVI